MRKVNRIKFYSSYIQSSFYNNNNLCHFEIATRFTNEPVLLETERSRTLQT